MCRSNTVLAAGETIMGPIFCTHRWCEGCATAVVNTVSNHPTMSSKRFGASALCWREAPLYSIWPGKCDVRQDVTIQDMMIRQDVIRQDMSWQDVNRRDRMWADQRGCDQTGFESSRQDVIRQDVSRADRMWSDRMWAEQTGCDQTGCEPTRQDVIRQDVIRQDVIRQDVNGPDRMLARQTWCHQRAEVWLMSLPLGCLTAWWHYAHTLQKGEQEGPAWRDGRSRRRVHARPQRRERIKGWVSTHSLGPGWWLTSWFGMMRQLE